MDDGAIVAPVLGFTVHKYTVLEFTWLYFTEGIQKQLKKDQMTLAFDISDTAELLGRISLCSVHPTMYLLFVAVEKSPPNAFIWCACHAGGDWISKIRINAALNFIEFGMFTNLSRMTSCKHSRRLINEGMFFMGFELIQSYQILALCFQSPPAWLVHQMKEFGGDFSTATNKWYIVGCTLHEADSAERFLSIWYVKSSGHLIFFLFLFFFVVTIDLSMDHCPGQF